VRPRRLAPAVVIDAMWWNPPFVVLGRHLGRRPPLCSGGADYACTAANGVGRCLTIRNRASRLGMNDREGLLRLEVVRRRPLALDQPVDVRAEAGELRQLLRCDLVAR